MKEILVCVLTIMNLVFCNTNEIVLINSINNQRYDISYFINKYEKLNKFTLIEEESTMYSTTSLNIRTFPSTEGDIIGAFYYGEEVNITAKIEDSSWVQVSMQDGVGYCNSYYLSKTKPQIVNRDGSINIVGNISENFIDSVYINYYKVSEQVRNKLKSEGWLIYITDENLSTKFSFDFSVLAVTDTKNQKKDIFISNREAAKEAIVHEIGHAIDCTLGLISNSDDFISIYNEEMQSFAFWHNTHSNNYGNPMEYFAEGFQEYIFHPNDLKSHCPKTYEYINTTVTNFK